MTGEPNNKDDGSFSVQYKEGFFWSLFSISLLLYVTAMIGVTFNAFLIYITVKYRSLHFSYNYLLAFTAFADILHEISYNVTLLHILLGKNFVELLPCFYAQFYAVIGLALSFTTNFLLALDRLISMVVPLW
uniref:G-protein coupled receptors family 1 profile domain-containing protein n=1 Tax=Ditylenchus dipsaci TaxID=166011 RepID=A0A915DIN6_9BILA